MILLYAKFFRPLIITALVFRFGLETVSGQTPLGSFNLPEVLFTDPLKVSQGKEDFVLLDRMLAFVNAVPTGEEITVCVFKFEKGRLAQALLVAQQRGVKVRVIINKGASSKKINQETKDLLKSELEDFHYIKNTITQKAIVHNKFILFSRVEGHSRSYYNVVLQTSSNFQDKGTGKLQDLIIIQDQPLYYAYLDFWYEIKVLGNAGELGKYDYHQFRSGLYNAYFFPKRKDGNEHGKDNIIKILKDIDDPKSTTLRFAHGKWTQGREQIVDRLDELISQGAQVEIVTNGDLDEEIIEELEELNAKLVVLGKGVNLHTKFFLVDDGVSQTVYTGSHNLSERSLRDNFEVLLEVNDFEVYEKYLNFFNQIGSLD